jgi:hypothetical protein
MYLLNEVPALTASAELLDSTGINMRCPDLIHTANIELFFLAELL